MSEDRFLCRSCGKVVEAEVAPVCRHGDQAGPTPSRTMVPLPAWHPLYVESEPFCEIDRADFEAAKRDPNVREFARRADELFARLKREGRIDW